ncbi:azurin [Thauera linaloolentis]|uniref:Azurin n=1 Tax=Thauera linaloolentis (strain DSM 12138 / JCM 21573 / CCUG 41526 / CIP 105981 / IAM 15112 / NBRC 102519 / 47Lol) TaxID=1123367 RepID=N6Z6Z2_THAL4|nr:azurin [Thauera linaloolentis]ENO90143.1 azurin [Thauera linaloolentis 47Lol = DSM 12138]MCM8564719.1 azurin [Thauera linaloolentis]
MKLKKIAACVLLSATVAPAWAACEATIEGNDAMQFNLKEIVVDKSCKQFTVTLKHVGKLAKASMGHNWVLAKTADVKDLAAEGAKAGPAKDYLNDGDARIVAHTKLLGGGESDSVTFDVSKLAAGTEYTYFCSFPGHWAVMKGVLKF